MRFDIITIFPKMFDSYLSESMIKRAQARGICDVRVHDLRAFSRNSHKKVDDRPYGGGPGMVVKAEPVIRAIRSLFKPSISQRLKKSKTKIIIFSAAGKQFDAKIAAALAQKYERIVLIAGRYEGVDERIFGALRSVAGKPQAISIGPYVLTGGELPALVVIDAVSRYLPGFLGKGESLEERRYGVGVPVYTRPKAFRIGKKIYRVPAVLLRGDHALIDAWRAKKRRKP